MTCAFPRCRQECDVLLLEVPICMDHWRAACNDATEAETFAKLGLVRDLTGEVVEVSKSNQQEPTQ